MRTCPVCGEPLQRKVYANGVAESDGQLARRKYCGNSCARIGHRKPDATLTAMRARSRLYRGDRCEACDGASYLVVHHKDENPRNDDPANLMTLCTRCHVRHHRGIARLDHGPPFDPSKYVREPKTECKHGHLYTPGNTYVGPNGKRVCRTCMRERRRQYEAQAAA